MASKVVRTVNVVPTAKKKKDLFEDYEDCVSCKLCSKGFASEVALNNHAKVEHVEAWLAGEDVCLRTVTKMNSKKFTAAQLKEFKEKTDKLISTMQLRSMTSTTSTDVSSIIDKDDTDRHAKRPKIDKSDKEKTPKKEKEPTPITGPFECLQPSNFVSNGTCHQMFFSCCEYSAHHRDEHTRRRKGLRCQVCERPLKAERAPYTCQTCGAGFERRKDLSEHCSTAHVRQKPFQCNICNKRFTQLGGLQQHMRIHTGDRPFNCTYCNKAFTQKSGLDQHLRIHTKFKPYRCVICNKTFCQSVHLQQHMRTHTNVAPFQCIVCQKRFKQSSHLNFHLKYHNPSNMTDEEKKKYSQLLQMVGKPGQDTEQSDQIIEQHCQVIDNYGHIIDEHRRIIGQNDQQVDQQEQSDQHDGDVSVLMEQGVLVEGQEYVEIGELLDGQKEGENNIYILPDDSGTINKC